MHYTGGFLGFWGFFCFFLVKMFYRWTWDMPYKKRAVCRIIALLFLTRAACRVAVNTFTWASCLFLSHFARLEFSLSTLSKEGWWQASNSFPIAGCLLPTSPFHGIVNRSSHDKDDCSKHLDWCCFNTKSILRWLTQVVPNKVAYKGWWSGTRHET